MTTRKETTEYGSMQGVNGTVIPVQDAIIKGLTVIVDNKSLQGITGTVIPVRDSTVKY